MTKLRIQGALYMFVLSAAVTVFSDAGSGTVTGGMADTRSSLTDKAAVLTADGGDPVPKPPMVGLAA